MIKVPIATDERLRMLSAVGRDPDVVLGDRRTLFADFADGRVSLSRLQLRSTSSTSGNLRTLPESQR